MEDTKGLEQRMDFLQERLDMVRDQMAIEFEFLEKDLAFWKKVALFAGVANFAWLLFFAWLVTR